MAVWGAKLAVLGAKLAVLGAKLAVLGAKLVALDAKIGSRRVDRANQNMQSCSAEDRLPFETPSE